MSDRGDDELEGLQRRLARYRALLKLATDAEAIRALKELIDEIEGRLRQFEEKG